MNLFCKVLPGLCASILFVAISGCDNSGIGGGGDSETTVVTGYFVGGVLLNGDDLAFEVRVEEDESGNLSGSAVVRNAASGLRLRLEGARYDDSLLFRLSSESENVGYIYEGRSQNRSCRLDGRVRAQGENRSVEMSLYNQSC